MLVIQNVSVFKTLYLSSKVMNTFDPRSQEFQASPDDTRENPISV